MFLGKQRQVKWAGLAVIAIAALVFVSSPVLAASQIHFDIDSETPGSISWAGGLNPLVGTDIEVDQVIGLGTPQLSGTAYNLIGGLLSFQTGGYVSYTPGTNINQWEFAGGGSLAITGSVDFAGDAPDIAHTTLMSGVFIYNGVVNLEHNFNSNEWLVTFASFNDDKNDLLLERYGMPDVPYYGDFNISFEVQGDSNLLDGFASTNVLSGDISNYPVPIPASALLLGSGIVGLIGFGKRMRKKVF